MVIRFNKLVDYLNVVCTPMFTLFFCGSYIEDAQPYWGSVTCIDNTWYEFATPIHLEDV